jgi:hypothetical protein
MPFKTQSGRVIKAEAQPLVAELSKGAKSVGLRPRFSLRRDHRTLSVRGP